MLNVGLLFLSSQLFLRREHFFDVNEKKMKAVSAQVDQIVMIVPLDIALSCSYHLSNVALRFASTSVGYFGRFTRYSEARAGVVLYDCSSRRLFDKIIALVNWYYWPMFARVYFLQAVSCLQLAIEDGLLSLAEVFSDVAAGPNVSSSGLLVERALGLSRRVCTPFHQS